MSKDLNVYVLGGGMLAYSISRAFYEEYGITTHVIASQDESTTSSSKFVDYMLFDGTRDSDRLLKFLEIIGRTLDSKALLVGISDFYARFLSKNKNYLSSWFDIPYIDFELLDKITKKDEFYKICEELSVPYPKSWNVYCTQDIEEIDYKNFNYPIIAKPSNSASYEAIDFNGKKKIYEIYSTDDFEKMYAAVSTSGYDHTMVCQDFIPGGDDSLYTLTVYCSTPGEPLLIGGGRVLIQDHSTYMLGNPVCILGQKVEPIIEDALKFLKHVRYVGFANFDIKYDERDGKYKFLEINTRMGKNTAYLCAGGVNFVRALSGDIPSLEEAYEPYLYSILPLSVAKKCLKDETLKLKLEEFYNAGNVYNPLDFKGDCVKHKLAVFLFKLRQIKHWKNYLG